MRESVVGIEVPEVGLVILCGASGSGKSTFAGKQFASTEVVSSDQCRALVGDDETDQSVTEPAFALLHDIVDKRLQVGRFTVVDATNVKPQDRKSLIDLARKWDVLVTAIVFDLALDVCLQRNAAREDRQTPEHAIRRQHKALRKSSKRLRAQGFHRVHTLSTPAELEAVSVTRTRLWTDRRDDMGPFDIIGDVHGCHTELLALLEQLGYDTTSDPISHNEERRVIFLGDLVDRGPGVPEVLDIAMSMVNAGTALCILGNHENKLGRALAGRDVHVTHGLGESLEQLDKRSVEYRQLVADFIDGLVSHYVLDGGKLVVAHAGLPERYHGRASGRVRSIALYGDTDGETDEYGLPIRYEWAEDYRGKAAVVYGHTPVPSAEWSNNTICLDTGSVFGGELTALRWPEKELVSVEAVEEYYEPIRPLVIEPVERPPLLLDVSDVLGKNYIETELAGRLTIESERTSAALEVMSRFAVDPRWLVHLPPTMAPVATSQRPDYLEHPDQAFDYFARAGTTEVVCEEKHMGSRAVLIFARDSDTALERFGVTNAASGVIVTRTGRPFFVDEAATGALLDDVRDAADRSDLWDSLSTDWLVIDAEILPWSAKAKELLQRQYAATGAAASTMLPAAESALAAAVVRGVDLGELKDKISSRVAHVGSYVEAYRQYCWETDGVDGIEIAPFQILAAEGEVLARRPHRWHLETIDALIEKLPKRFRRTERRFVDLGDETQVAAATQWWAESTNSG
ncbi:MAG: polynucleotide kinase-phosphatase, partial [Actinobacteria bacterium]|nr:polynucleotide kinase-phosphatase [Actinomycetota bacterium]